MTVATTSARSQAPRRRCGDPDRVPSRAVRLVRRRRLRGARPAARRTGASPRCGGCAACTTAPPADRHGRGRGRRPRPSVTVETVGRGDDPRSARRGTPGRPDRARRPGRRSPSATVLSPCPRRRQAPSRSPSRVTGPGAGKVGLRAPAGPRRAVRRGGRGARPPRLRHATPTTWSSSSATAPSSTWSPSRTGPTTRCTSPRTHAMLGRDATLRHTWSPSAATWSGSARR